ncbi:hypothetical protein [Streptomyces triticiradicis]|uniref:DMT family transporter n=1 Tax=Streptomyces triticiradicis TaxID=2651189 RepID=A0A7J5D588_9ACTN|nr:hypothetical protein [Streptomyces triticiradicis]KAB1979409.1 hypothetical protein F8144_35925 [Streptomyces triticiradicis]
MPIVLTLASVLLQAGAEGFLSGRLDVTASLRLSLLAFLATTAVFTAVTWLRRRSRPGPPATAAQRARIRGLLWRMNIASTVTFLGFYLALAWVPAALGASLVAGVGPLAVLLMGTRAGTKPSGPVAWARAVLLLAVSLATAACIQPGLLLGAGPMVYAGAVLAVLAGFGAASLAVVSRRLGALGVDPTRVMAHRFHLTYVLATVLLVLRGGGGTSELSVGTTVITALVGVVVPLYLLQISVQRCPPLVTMVLLTALPGLTYMAQVAFGDAFRPPAAAMVVILVALTVVFALLEARPPRSVPSQVPVRSPRRV